MSKKKPSVAIIMGSDSDYRIMKDAVDTLKSFAITPHVEVVSAHRTPQRMIEFAEQAKAQGIEVIIAGAGGAAHLPGMVASATPLPVIGIPVKLASMDGLDSLLSIVQMPKGVPVATMAVDNATNGALLAVRILSLKDEKLALKLDKYIKGLTTKVAAMNKKLKAKV